MMMIRVILYQTFNKQSVSYIKEYANYIILNVDKNDDNDSDDDDMSTMLGILAIQNKGVLLIINQFIPTFLLVL